MDDLETIEFSDVLGAIAEDKLLTRCAQVCFAGTEEGIKLNSTIRERLTKSWKTETWKKEETPWKKPIEKLIYLNRCLYPVIHNQRKNVYHLGFVSLAEFALQSNGYTKIGSERKFDPLLCKGDLVFFCKLSCDTGQFASLGTRAHPW